MLYIYICPVYVEPYRADQQVRAKLENGQEVNVHMGKAVGKLAVAHHPQNRCHGMTCSVGTLWAQTIMTSYAMICVQVVLRDKEPEECQACRYEPR